MGSGKKHGLGQNYPNFHFFFAYFRVYHHVIMFKIVVKKLRFCWTNLHPSLGPRIVDTWWVDLGGEEHR